MNEIGGCGAFESFPATAQRRLRRRACIGSAGLSRRICSGTGIPSPRDEGYKLSAGLRNVVNRFIFGHPAFARTTWMAS